MTDTTLLTTHNQNGSAPLDDGLIVRVMKVTPDLAAAWLERNPLNRHLNQRYVATLAGAMSRGEWRVNGDAIRRTAADELLDGQHRLAAVVASGVTIESLVVDGLDPASQITMDTNRKRSFADQLKMRGEHEYNAVAALVNKIYRWESGQPLSHNKPATYDQLLAIYERSSGLDASVRVAHSVRRQLPVAASILSLAHYLFSRIDVTDAEFFFGRLKDGQGLIDGDAILALRKYILNSLAGPRGRGRVDDATLLAVVIKGWNAFRAGTPVKTLWWRSGGAKPEAFPEPM